MHVSAIVFTRYGCEWLIIPDMIHLIVILQMDTCGKSGVNTCIDI